MVSPDGWRLSRKTLKKPVSCSTSGSTRTVARSPGSSAPAVPSVIWTRASSGLSIRPQIAEEVVRALRFRTGQKVLSLLAATGIDAIRDWIGLDLAVIRAIPLPFVVDRRCVTPIFPADPEVAALFDRLGVRDTATLKEFPNGQTAMAAMAVSDLASPIGCTQVTEILNTDGVDYVGALPAPFDLSTVYSAAVAIGAEAPDDARALIALLADPGNVDLRRSVGFT